MPNYLEKTFTANGNSEEFAVGRLEQVSISGLTAAGAGSVSLQRSTDAGDTFQTVMLPDFTAATFTADATFDILETAETLYRFVMADYASGSIVARIGQKGI